MPDGGDRRNRAGGNRACHRLLVERPQIFERSPSAANQDDVVQLPAREVANGNGDLAGCVPALHAHRINLYVKAGEAAAENVQHVADGGAGRTGDDGDPLGQHRDRFFPRGIKKALIGELLLELFEGQLQRTEAGGLDGYRVELELSLLLLKSE